MTPETIQSQPVTDIDETVAQCKVFKADDPQETNLLQYNEKWISDIPNRPFELTGFRNNTELVFEATLVNPLEVSITLREFRVDFYNINGSSLVVGVNTTFISNVSKIFSQKAAESVVIDGGCTKTDQIKMKLGLPHYKQEAPPEEVGTAEQQVEEEGQRKNDTVAYITRFAFEYDQGSSRSVNFTLHILPEPTEKPVFLLYLIGGFTAIVLAMMTLAIYGRIALQRKGLAT